MDSVYGTYWYMGIYPSFYCLVDFLYDENRSDICMSFGRKMSL